MKKFCKTKSPAFTLIELLITMIVIGVLAGCIMLVTGSGDEKAKAAACLGEREKIKAAYSLEKLGNGDSFADRLKAAMSNVPQAEEESVSESEAKYKGLCEDGGEYTVTKANSSVLVSCSVHGEETQSSSSAGTKYSLYLYNTHDTIPISDSNYWKTSPDFVVAMNASNKTYKTGTLIKIGDICYVALTDVTGAAGGRELTYLNSGAFKSIPSTQIENAIDWSQVKSANSGYATGDICLYNGDYYIAKEGVGVGVMASSTPDKSSSWIKLSKTL